MADPLELPPDFLRPRYQNGSIANIPATIAALFGVPFTGLPPLEERLWQPLGEGIKRVVAIVIDALGWNLVEKEQTLFGPLLERAAVAGQLTSVFPSTTVAALSSIWTGAAPAQHGMVGLRLFFPEYGTIGDMLKFSPTFGRFPDALVAAGLAPEEFLEWPGVASQFAAAGIPVHIFKGHEIVHSALSKMHDRGAASTHGAVNLADMLVQIRELLEDKAGERLFISAYWPDVDTLSHRYGWRGPGVAAELRAIFQQLQAELWASLSSAARRETTLIIFADHGQVDTPAAQRIYLQDHPDLAAMLFMKPTGEPRVSYLYTRHDSQDEAGDYCRHHFPEAMAIWPTADALQAGFLGPGPFAARAAERLGDLVLAMRDGYILLQSREADQGKADLMRARHGGMTGAEMQVPWLGFRLDG